MADFQINASYKKSFISDVIQKIEGENISSTLETSRVLLKAHILGFISGIKKYHQRTIFVVDDGTGQLDCILWHRESPVLEKVYELKQDLKYGTTDLNHDLKNCAFSLLDKADSSLLEEADSYSHGDIISCLGPIRLYREKPQLEIHHVYKPSNVDSETLWMLDVLASKEDFQISLS